MSSKTLLLTREFTPYKVLSWDRTMMMLFQGKIEVVEEYPDVIGSIPGVRIREFPQVSRAFGNRFQDGQDVLIRVPSVARLWKAVGNVKRGAKFSRINVFTRDGFRCQYCGEQKSFDSLNYDHVIPRHLGGKTVWENIVTSCYPCNSRKANRTPEQAGMRLRKIPCKPKTLPILGPKFDPRDVHPSWLAYCVGFLDDSASSAA